MTQFADPVGAGNNFQWTGNDFFADKNVFGIVLEVPNRALGPNPRVGIWARVLVPHDGRLVQADRAGRPAIDATFNQSDDDKRIWNQQSRPRIENSSSTSSRTSLSTRAIPATRRSPSRGIYSRSPDL